MRAILILLSVLLVAGCETDLLVPCEESNGPAGRVCREYRYVDDASVGYVEYEYQGDSLCRSYFYDSQVRLKKTVTQRYENGRISSIAEQFTNGPSRVQTWHYLENDSLYRIVHGANDSVMELTYSEGKRVGQAFFHNGELQRRTEFRYFQDDGKLYRISYYNAEDSLLSYRNHEYFSTGQQRVSYYTSTHQLVGRRVYRFSQLGLITSNEFTDAEGTVTYHATYIYDAAGKLTEAAAVELDQVSKQVYLYY